MRSVPTFFVFAGVLLCAGLGAAYPSFSEIERVRRGTGEGDVDAPDSYLSPPSTESSVVDLGYEASDLLVPPPEDLEVSPYQTLPEGHRDSLDEGTIIVGKRREAPNPPDRLQDTEDPDLISYVKTDRLGHFKWGVAYTH